MNQKQNLVYKANSMHDQQIPSYPILDKAGGSDLRTMTMLRVLMFQLERIPLYYYIIYYTAHNNFIKYNESFSPLEEMFHLDPFQYKTCVMQTEACRHWRREEKKNTHEF